MLHTQLAALALAAITLAASGCGGSSKTESATTAASTSTPATTTSAATTSAVKEPGNALTRAELITAADAICARINAKRASTKLTSERAYVRLVPPLAAYEKAAAVEMSKLTPPASLASEWKQIADGIRTVANDTAEIGQDIISHRRKAQLALINSATEFDLKIRAIARRGGFKDCAQS